MSSHKQLCIQIFETFQELTLRRHRS